MSIFLHICQLLRKKRVFACLSYEETVVYLISERTYNKTSSVPFLVMIENVRSVCKVCVCVWERERDKALKCEWYRFVRIYFHLDSISPIRQIYLTHSNKTVSLCVAWCWCFHDVFTTIYIEAYSPPLVLMNIWKKRVFLREELDIHNTTTRMTRTFYDAVRRKKSLLKLQIFANSFSQSFLRVVVVFLRVHVNVFHCCHIV